MGKTARFEMSGRRAGTSAMLSAAVRGRAVVEVGVWPFLQWAFQRECAQLDFDDTGAQELMGPGFGMEYVLLQRARLGGHRIDGGGRSPCHPDADLAAAALAALPEGHGGRRMAVTVAELARSGLVPDCMIDARPACVPVSWGKDNQHGRQAKTDTMGRGFYNQRGRVREYDRRYCPVTYTPTASAIAAARRHYLMWYGALLYVRAALQGPCGLTAFRITNAMPPMKPWERG